LLLPLFFLTVSGAYAQRKNIMGAQLGFSGGGSNQIGGSGFSLVQFQSGMTPYYSVTPTLTMKSQGAKSELDLSYSFMWQRYDGNTVTTTMSHVADLMWSARLGKRASMTFGDSFSSALSNTLSNVISGITSTPEGFSYLFEPALASTSSYTDNANASLTVNVGRESSLIIGGSSSYRHYEQATASAGQLGDQLRVEGNFAYSRKLSSHHTWHIRYSAAENRYQQYSNTLTHTAGIGSSLELTKTLRLNLDAGLSYTQSQKLQQNLRGYNASFNISKSLNKNVFSLNLAHNSGDSTGIGSTSDTDSGGLGFSRVFGRRVTLTSNLQAFRSTGQLDNPYNPRSYSGAAALSIALSRYWALNFGGSYRKNEGASVYNSSYDNVYLSIRFTAPELWRWQ
jgi:hypothetical protein